MHSIKLNEHYIHNSGTSLKHLPLANIEQVLLFCRHHTTTHLLDLISVNDEYDT